jgi:hypothetical protein
MYIYIHIIVTMILIIANVVIMLLMTGLIISLIIVVIMIMIIIITIVIVVITLLLIIMLVIVLSLCWLIYIVMMMMIPHLWLFPWENCDVAHLRMAQNDWLPQSHLPLVIQRSNGKTHDSWPMCTWCCHQTLPSNPLCLITKGFPADSVTDQDGMFGEPPLTYMSKNGWWGEPVQFFVQHINNCQSLGMWNSWFSTFFCISIENIKEVELFLLWKWRDKSKLSFEQVSNWLHVR